MATDIRNPLYPRPDVKGGQTITGVSSGFAKQGALINVTSTTVPTSFMLSMFTTSTTPPVELIFLDIQSAAVCVTFDGAAPLYGTSGHFLASGTNYTWQWGTLQAAKFCLTSAGSAQIYASQFTV